MSMLKELISEISAVAEGPVHHQDEDFVLIERISNYDDAYELGVEAGRAELARELMDLIEAES